MTRSTFSGFTIAQLGMAASQRALDVTGQNIANINTKGYTRQRVDVVSLNLHGGDKYSTGPGSKIGYGVEVTGVSQIRDPFLDVQYRNQIAKVGEADSRQAILDQLADIFDETDKDALKTCLSDITSALSKLSDNVSLGDGSVRTNFQTLLNIIHQKSQDLSDVRNETIYGLEKTDIASVNGLLSDIGELNDSIWKSQVLGNPALELKDQRNSKLDELASYLPISVTYKSVNIADGASYDYPVVKFTGSDGFTYNLTSGEHGENFASLSVERNLDANGNEDGTVSISLTPASDFSSDADMSALKTDITSDISSGSLKGVLDMLNKSGQLDDPPTDYRGIGYYEKAFDSFVDTFAKLFNDLNENSTAYTGVSSIPASGAATEIINPSGSEVAEYSIDFQSASGNFLNGEKIEINGQTYTFGVDVTLGSDLNDSLSNLAGELDSTATDLSVNGSSMPGHWSYAGGKLAWKSTGTVPSGVDIDSNSIKTSGGAPVTVTYTANPSNVQNYDLFETTDGTNTFTANNIKISEDWLNGSIHLKASQKEDAGSTDNDNLIRMIDALKTKREFAYEYTYIDSSGNPQNGSTTFFNGSINEFYAGLENTQGIDSSSNKAILNNHIAVVQETSNNKDSVSGVSLDEEGINLMKFQKSYTAAARLMTTLDEALDVLINKTGVVGR